MMLSDESTSNNGVPEALEAPLADTESLGPKERMIRRLYEKREETEFDPESLLHAKTRRLRTRVWEMWTEFATISKSDPEDFWIDFRRGQDRERDQCVVFLEYYVGQSTTERPCLGDSESEIVRTVDCAVTLEDVWSALVQVANIKVMKPRREAEPEKSDYWILKRRKGGGFVEPADAVAKYIPVIARELDLSLEQTFEKIEMTSTDVISIIDIVCTRADAIPCTPEQRLAFITVVVFMGIGGWRSASLLGKKYKDTEFGWLRDPCDPSKTWPVASNLIRHVKIGKNHILRNQRHLLKFTIAMVDYPPLCLLRLLLCRANADQAFEAGFCNLEDVTQPKTLEDGIDYTPLRWKKVMLEKEIIPLTYHKFLEIWNRCMLVAGLQDRKRPHSMRVGTGGRLDGSLTGALRNFILSNSTDVFEKSYQPVDLRVNLMKISFGALAGDTDALIAKRHEAFTERDPHAPIYITERDWQQFNERDGIRSRRDERKRACLRGGSQCKEVKRLDGEIAHILNTLEQQRILERRHEYFQEASKLRAKGLSTKHLQSETASNPRPKMHQKYSSVAMAYGRALFSIPQCPNPFDLLAKSLTGEPNYNNESRPKNGSHCFLCSKTFSNKSGLTRHVHQTHIDTFDQSFDCPECQRQGRKVCIRDRIGWSSHTKKAHGAMHTPNPRGARPQQEVHCFLCSKSFRSSGFNLHFDRSHVKLGKFDREFACPADGLTIVDLKAWIVHVQTDHKGGKIKGAGTKPQSSCASAKAR